MHIFEVVRANCL